MARRFAAIPLVLGWSVVHTVFSLRYAELYYRGTPQGIDFNEDDAPCYTDSPRYDGGVRGSLRAIRAATSSHFSMMA